MKKLNKNFPKLRFELNQKLDEKLAWNLYQYPSGGDIEFWESGLGLYEKLVLQESKKKKKKIVKDYVKKLYLENKKDFTRQSKRIESNYHKKEKKFFEITKKIFKNHVWPKGPYFCYLSIFPQPRFIGRKSFQLFLYHYEKETQIIIFHEMLHIMFYDYALKIFPEYFRGLDQEEGSIFWEMAEIFNSIIQETNQFKKLHGPTRGSFYPFQRKKFIILKKIWREHRDIDKWIIYSFKYLKKKKKVQSKLSLEKK